MFLPAGPRGEKLTEECFQRMPLQFDRTKQALVWNNGTRYPLAGVWVDQGTDACVCVYIVC